MCTQSIAWYVAYGPVFFLSVCIETAKLIKLIFDTEATLDLFYTTLYGNSGISINKDTSLWNVVLTLNKDDFLLFRYEVTSSTVRPWQICLRERPPVCNIMTVMRTASRNSSATADTVRSW